MIDLLARRWAAKQGLIDILRRIEVNDTTKDRRHQAIPGVRIARICNECLTRKFGDPDWKCTCAGGRKTVTQTNQPYFGQSTA